MSSGQLEGGLRRRALKSNMADREQGKTGKHATRDSVSPKPKMVWDRKETENGLGQQDACLLFVVLFRNAIR